MRPRLVPALLSIALLAGCAGKVAVPEVDDGAAGADPSASLEVPSSPRSVVDGVARTWNRRDWRGYGNLLAGDFRFVFSLADTAGSLYRTRPFDRESELLAMSRMFEFGASEAPPMSRVVFSMDRTLELSPDPRPGKSYPAHQVARANIVLSADNGEKSYRITGSMLLFVVRGDSADIPQPLLDRGYRPDAGRWWLERWEDETLQLDGAPSAAMPAGLTTLGALKALYLR